MDDEFALIKTREEVSPASIQSLIDSIRPTWQGKGLIKRVERLLPVDPSSACQRLFNATVFDLREKIVTIGIDIAKEIAKTYKLPPIEKEEDILENYSATNIIDLSYRVGLLNRPEWRRIQRCYEIRKDLEHEDNEYEAVLEDCFYIFKSTIEVVLSQDPVELLKVTDVKQIIENPLKITVSEDLLKDYNHAPELRQKEIIAFLISIVQDSEQPDIVRENSFELLRHFKSLTKTQVVIETAKALESKLGRNPIDLVTAKIGHATGATAYFKKAKIKDYYSTILKKFNSAGTKWSEQAKAVSLFYDIGAFTYCPNDSINDFLQFLVKWYIGEPGGYGAYGWNRAVFYGDAATPIIARIIKHSDRNLYELIDKLRSEKAFKYSLSDKHIFARFERLLDFADKSITSV